MEIIFAMAPLAALHEKFVFLIVIVVLAIVIIAASLLHVPIAYLGFVIVIIGYHYRNKSDAGAVTVTGEGTGEAEQRSRRVGFAASGPVSVLTIASGALVMLFGVKSGTPEDIVPSARRSVASMVAPISSGVSETISPDTKSPYSMSLISSDDLKPVETPGRRLSPAEEEEIRIIVERFRKISEKHKDLFDEESVRSKTRPASRPSE